MKQIIMKPEIQYYDDCKAFIEATNITKKDLILTNEFIYEPYFQPFQLDAQVLYQERYGSGEPTDVMVDQILRDAQTLGCERIIAIGGGTIIDIAKVMAVAIDERVDTLYEQMDQLQKKRALMILPTTCGTGSEVTNISIINRTSIGTKMGLVSEAMFANQAILIPELLKSLPFSVFATSSIDALVHAVESALSPKATPYTKLFSYKAIEMIIQGYQQIVAQGKEKRFDLSKEFLIASNYAGLAFGTAGCAAVHATSYPLGGTYHVPHGESNYAMFTGVLYRYMELRKDGEIAILNAFLANLLDCSTEVVYKKLEYLLNQILPKKRLREYGVKEEDLAIFTKQVMNTQSRLMGNNFVELDADSILHLYQSLY